MEQGRCQGVHQPVFRGSEGVARIRPAGETLGLRQFRPARQKEKAGEEPEDRRRHPHHSPPRSDVQAREQTQGQGRRLLRLAAIAVLNLKTRAKSALQNPYRQNLIRERRTGLTLILIVSKKRKL